MQKQVEIDTAASILINPFIGPSTRTSARPATRRSVRPPTPRSTSRSVPPGRAGGRGAGQDW